MRKCHNCGRTPASANKRFCQYCGAPTKRTAAGPNSTGRSPGPGQPPWRATGTPNRLLITCGAILGFAVVVAIVLVVVISRSDAPDETAIASSNEGNSAVGSLSTQPPLAVSTTSSVPEFPSDEPTTTDPSDNGPATVVQNYYAAVNNRDFQTAWQLGGDNLGKPYTVFVNGYATTVSDELTVVDTIGDTVDIDLTAQWNDGTTHEYQGSYTVANGKIISGALHKIS